MAKKQTIFQQMDEKLAAQLRIQRYQASLAEEAKQNKEFQDRIKNLVFEVRKKTESLISSSSDLNLKAAASMFALNTFNKLPLTASNFNEIADKEYFHATVTNFEAVINSISSEKRAKLEKALNAYSQLEKIDQAEEEYEVFDAGKSKAAKWIYIVLYPLICIVTVIGIPLLFFTKKVVRWAEGSQYKAFRSIAIMNLDVNKLPAGFLKNYLSKPFTGKYPELKEVKNLTIFREYCIEQRNFAAQEINQANDSMPGIKKIADSFI